MGTKQKTVIVTGASQGIGAGVAQAFLDRGYNVVANSRNITKSGAFNGSGQLVLVDGNIGESAVAAKVIETAISKFGSIDALVNNAGIFFAKAFTDYTAEDFKALSTTNLEGFLYVTQGAVKQMLAQKTGGSVVGITSSLVVNPIAGVSVSVPMITKGGLEAVTRSLASEYAKEHIRFNTVAPGVVDTPLHKDNQRTSSRPCRRWARSPLRRTLQARWFISPNRARSLGRCCTWTAVSTTANGKPEQFAVCQRGATAAGSRDRAPQRSPSAWRIRRGSVQSGSLLFLSGMLPIKDGEPQYVGRLGKELDADAGRDALRTATLNALSAAKEHTGSLDRVSKVVRVGVYLATSGDFYNQPTVADAASELLRDAFGEDKMSVRSVFGVASLPLGLPVMLEVTFEVNS